MNKPVQVFDTITISVSFFFHDDKTSSVNKAFLKYDNSTIVNAFRLFALSNEMLSDDYKPKNKINGYNWYITKIETDCTKNTVAISLTKTKGQESDKSYETIKSYIKKREKRTIWNTINYFFNSLKQKS